jgi:hypothetical protein
MELSFSSSAINNNNNNNNNSNNIINNHLIDNVDNTDIDEVSINQLNYIREMIENMNKFNQIEVLRLLSKHNKDVIFNENKYGVHINLSELKNEFNGLKMIEGEIVDCGGFYEFNNNSNKK